MKANTSGIHYLLWAIRGIALGDEELQEIQLKGDTVETIFFEDELILEMPDSSTTTQYLRNSTEMVLPVDAGTYDRVLLRGNSQPTDSYIILELDQPIEADYDGSVTIKAQDLKINPLGIEEV